MTGGDELDNKNNKNNKNNDMGSEAEVMNQSHESEGADISMPETSASATKQGLFARIKKSARDGIRSIFGKKEDPNIYPHF